MQESGGTRTYTIWIILCLFTGISVAHSQPLLPNISVTNQNGKNYISWTSAYTGVRQIGVQRSQDSLYNFATIGYARNPDSKHNVFTDSRPLTGTQYYKLIIVLNSGKYFFSNPVKVHFDSFAVSVPPPPSKAATSATTAAPVIKPANVFVPSIYVYTNPDGNVNISLSDAATQHYHIWFYDSSNVKLFSVDEINQPFLIIDKSNFLHSGWFHFELYEGEKLKEKSKFFIPAQLKDDPKPKPQRRFRRR